MQLESLELVTRAGESWLATHSTIHLGRTSPFNSTNHSNWRRKAVDNSFLNVEGDVHYTSVCTLSSPDAIKIKEHILALIDVSRSIIGPSEPEDLHCLTLDWFEV